MAKHDGNVNSHNELSPGHGGEHPTVGHESSARLEDESEPPDPPISDDSTFRSSQVARSSRSSSHSGKDDDARDINAAHVIVTLVDEHGDRSSPASSHQQHMQVGDAATKAHTLTTERCVSQLKTDAELGLSEADAKSRLEANGSNTIKEAKATSVWTILLHQVANALTVILLAAMALSFGVRDWVEGGVVCAVIAINVAIGFVQEYKAEHALASLRSLSSPLATVIRDGQVQEIDARNIVVGDIVNFRVGDLMPADLRIASSTNLEIEEASLTGESVPVIKTLDPIVEEDGIAAPPADCTNMAFAGTTVTKGRGRGLVIATGMNTQIGCIARQLDRRGGKKDNTSLPLWRQIYEPIARFLGLRSGTPLQRKLSAFALILLALALVCAIIVFAVAEFDLTNEVILYAIALGIGVLPESLIAVLTITFSVGAKRMAKSNVVVRKLDALEALGGISDIFSDKTGTLTHGKMVVNKAWLVNSEETWRIEQGGEEVLEPKGAIVREDKGGQEVGEEARTNNLHPLALAASLCNLAEVYRDYDTEKWQSRGDPTEVALQVFALKMGFDRAQLLEKQYSLEQEHPFDSMTKRMTMMYSIQTGDATGREKVLFMKGAPERVLDCCSTYQRNSEGPSPISLDEEARHRITAQMETLASHGLRVLAFARRRLTDVEYYKLGQEKLTRAVAEQDFEFIGLCGLHDPPRMETLEAVRTCQGGHIIVHMLTGDHISTARAIARQVGILDGTEPASAVMTASKFDAMSDEEVDKLPMLPLVIARCSPTTKVRMVAAGERRKTFLLMCGDGINDAPALLHAPIGIAMGSGTEVAKDSAQLILTDDKFDNIPKAVKEGRTVFKNIQRFMVALLVLNVAEVLLLLIGLAIRDDSHESVFPISPIGILILNLVAGLPAIGLGFEEAEEDVMTKPPHNVKAGVLSRQVIWDLFIYGFTMGWTSLVVFVGMIYGVHGAGSSLGSDCNGEGSEFSATACTAIFEARSATFCTLFLQGLIITWHLISIEETLFRIQTVQRLGRNKFLLWSVIFGFACIPICIYVPVWSTDIFRQSSLSGEGWGVALGANALFLLVVELWKFAARRGAWPWLTRFTGGSPSRKRSSHGMEEKHSA